MKVIIILSLVLCSLSIVHSQDCVKILEELTLEKNSLQKQDLANKDSISKLNANINKTTTELNDAKKRISELDKNKIKKDYDKLKKESESLKKDSEKLKKENENFKNDNEKLKKENETFKNDNEELKKENGSFKKANESLKEENGSFKKDNEKLKKENESFKKANESLKEENGSLKKDNDSLKKKEIQIIEIYKNSFDELIKSSTKHSIQRDMRLIGDNKEVKPILSDLEKYFNAEELLTKKYNLVQINDAQKNLKQIKQKSLLLDTLKRNVEEYKDFYDELKKAIEKLITLDKNMKASGVPQVQKDKFQDILTILGDYMYNYYDYVNYPYLKDIILEIIKRKQRNADEDITDLMRKL